MKRTWLSLQQRIDLALHHLTAGLDWRPIVKGTALEGIPFCLVTMGQRLVEYHAWCDLTECPGRYLTPLALCLDANPTFAANGRSARQVAQHFAGYLDRRVNRQGLLEVREEELAAIKAPDQVFVESFKRQDRRKIANSWWDGARGVIKETTNWIPLEGLVRWYVQAEERQTKATIARMIRGRINDPAGPGEFFGAILTPLALFYEATGDAAAKSYLEENAERFLKKGLLEYFPDGKHSNGSGVGHLHIRMGAIAGLARYAKLAGRPDYRDLAGELLTVNAQYGTEFGWMPERHVFTYQSTGHSGTIYQPWAVLAGQKIDFAHYARPRHGWDTCEICVTADAVDAAIILAQNGSEKYWDIAERYLNHIFETQVRDDSFIIERERGRRAEMIGAKFDNVREDILGSFLSASSPTWAVGRKQYAKMRPDGREGVGEGRYYGISCACCPGWGARTLGLVWQNIVTEAGRQVAVNFPFDRRTDKVVIKSSLPFAGKIAVQALQPVDLFVRIPDWVEHARVEVRLNGKRRDQVEFKNPFSDYVKVGRVNPGEKVDVSYPLRVETKRYHIEYHPNLYEAEWLGNYVMSMKEIRVAKGQGAETFSGIGQLYRFQ